LTGSDFVLKWFSAIKMRIAILNIEIKPGK